MNPLSNPSSTTDSAFWVKMTPFFFLCVDAYHVPLNGKEIFDSFINIAPPPQKKKTLNYLSIVRIYVMNSAHEKFI